MLPYIKQPMHQVNVAECKCEFVYTFAGGCTQTWHSSSVLQNILASLSWTLRMIMRHYVDE